MVSQWCCPEDALQGERSGFESSPYAEAPVVLSTRREQLMEEAGDLWQTHARTQPLCTKCREIGLRAPVKQLSLSGHGEVMTVDA